MFVGLWNPFRDIELGYIIPYSGPRDRDGIFLSFRPRIDLCFRCIFWIYVIKDARRIVVSTPLLLLSQDWIILSHLSFQTFFLNIKIKRNKTFVSNAAAVLSKTHIFLCNLILVVSWIFPSIAHFLKFLNVIELGASPKIAAQIFVICWGVMVWSLQWLSQ